MTASIDLNGPKPGGESSIKIDEPELNFLTCNSSVTSSATSTVSGIDTSISFFEAMFYERSKVKDYKVISVVFAVGIIAFICFLSGLTKFITNNLAFD